MCSMLRLSGQLRTREVLRSEEVSIRCAASMRKVALSLPQEGEPKAFDLSCVLLSHRVGASNPRQSCIHLNNPKLLFLFCSLS